MHLAESLIDLGKLEKARIHLEEGHSYSEKYGELFYAAELERLTAELLRAEGAPRHAIELHLNKAIQIARSQGARLLEIRAATDLAWLWRDEDRRDEASALLTPIYGWFTEGFDMLDLKNAKTLLDELHAGRSIRNGL